jgi:hypothetical protein
MNKIIPKCKLFKIKCGKYKNEMSYGLYYPLRTQINLNITNILDIHEPKKPSEKPTK